MPSSRPVAAEGATTAGSAGLTVRPLPDGGLGLHGRLGFGNARQALAALWSALPSREGGSSLRVDLGGLGHGDSAGLATLVEWRAQAARCGWHLRLCGAPESLRALARLSDLEAELFD